MECVGVLFYLEDTEYLYKKIIDAYGAVCKPPPDDFPLELSSIFSGASWTNVRKIITFVCNACAHRLRCRLCRMLYDARYAQQRYEQMLS